MRAKSLPLEGKVAKIFDFWRMRCKVLACARHFDLLHNSLPTVSIYADRSELFVLPALLTSVRLSKNLFFGKLVAAEKGS